MREKRTISISCTFILLAALLLAGCSSDVSGAPQPISVKAVKLGSSEEPVLNGKIIPDQQIKITSKIAGKVSALSADEGSKVKKGDVLIQLDSDDLRQQAKQAESGLIAAQSRLADAKAGARSQEIIALESAVKQAEAACSQAQAIVDQAKTGYDLAQRTYARLRNQYDSNASVTREDLDKGTFEFEKAKAAYEQARAQEKTATASLTAAKAKLDLAKEGATTNTLEALQAEVDRLNAGLELAKNALANASIQAPVDGVIVQRSIQAGEMAQPGVPLLTLVNMDRVQIELSIPEGLVHTLKVGTEVMVKAANAGGKSFAGKVQFVSPVSAPNSSTFPAKVIVDNPEGLLLAGTVAEIFAGDIGRSGMEVPKSALVQKEGKTYVFLVEGQNVRQLEVKTKEKNQNWVYVIESSLKENDRVVIQPPEQLQEGSVVKVE